MVRDGLAESARYRRSGDFESALAVCEKLRANPAASGASRALVALETARVYQARAARQTDHSSADADRAASVQHAKESIQAMVHPQGNSLREAVHLLDSQRRTGDFSAGAWAYQALTGQTRLSQPDRLDMASAFCDSLVNCAPRSECPLEGAGDSWRGRLGFARELLRQEIDRAESLARPPSERLAGLLMCAGNLERSAGKPRDALPLFSQASALVADSGNQAVRVSVLQSQLGAAVESGDYEKIGAFSKQLEPLARGDPRPQVHQTLGVAAWAMGDLQNAMGNLSLAASQACGDPSVLAAIQCNRAGCAMELGQFEDAEQYLREADQRLPGAPLDARSRLTVRRNMARFHLTFYRLDDARKELDSVWAEQRKLFGDDDPETLRTEADLAFLDFQRGDLYPAAGRYSRAIDLMSATMGKDNVEVAQLRLKLASVDAERATPGAPEFCKTALETADSALAALGESIGWSHQRAVLAAIDRLTIAEKCREVTGDTSAVADAFVDAAQRVEQLQVQLGEENLLVVEANALLAAISARAQTRPEEALAKIARAEAAYHKLVRLSNCHPAMIRLLEAKARLEIASGDIASARGSCETALECSAAWLARHPLRADLQGALGICFLHQGAKEEAQQLFREAYDMLTKIYPQEHPWVQQYLSRHERYWNDR
jgi:tetratricopeptide (TPR) repeat protein